MLIGVAGRANTGKSFSLRNLPSSEIAILNVDMKRISKKMMSDGGEGLTVVDIKNYPSFVKMLANVESSDKNYVVIDTFTKLISRIEEEATKLYGKNFSKWSFYKEEIIKTIDFMKNSKKFYIIPMHTTTYINETTGEQREEIKVSGALAKEGGIDGMLDIMVHSFMRNDEDGMKFLFDTHTNPSNNARSPLGMFEDRFIENDIQIVVEKSKEYYEL